VGVTEKDWRDKKDGEEHRERGNRWDASLLRHIKDVVEVEGTKKRKCGRNRKSLIKRINNTRRKRRMGPTRLREKLVHRTEHSF